MTVKIDTENKTAKKELLKLIEYHKILTKRMFNKADSADETSDDFFEDILGYMTNYTQTAIPILREAKNNNGSLKSFISQFHAESLLLASSLVGEVLYCTVLVNKMTYSSEHHLPIDLDHDLSVFVRQGMITDSVMFVLDNGRHYSKQIGF